MMPNSACHKVNYKITKFIFLFTITFVLICDVRNFHLSEGTMNPLLRFIVLHATTKIQDIVEPCIT